jgi:hypothetical protein
VDRDPELPGPSKPTSRTREDGVIEAMARTRIVIEKDDPAKCGCDDAYRVVERDDRNRVVRVHGEAIKGGTSRAKPVSSTNATDPGRTFT